MCDPAARALSNEARDAIVTYLSVSTGTGENSDRKLKQTFIAPIHPLISRAYDILEPYFRDCICSEHGQGLLVQRKKFVALLNDLPNESVRQQLYKMWDKDDERNPSLSGAERWQQLKDATSGTTTSGSGDKKRPRDGGDLVAWRIELVMTYCYPRLDANVSKQQNHLLKSPFCVHPKTGRVCIPIDPNRADDFDPFAVPTLRQLCSQIDAYDGPECEDIEKTDMKKAMEVFDQSFMHDMKTCNRKDFREKAELLRDERDQQAAMEIAF